MGSIQYLVRVAGEKAVDSPNNAILGLHFAPDSSGLAGIPEKIPAGSILLLDDRIAPTAASLKTALSQLETAISRLQPMGLYLDFQHPGDITTQQFAEAIAAAFPDLTAVSHHYAGQLPCPVVLPPIPLYIPADAYLAAWQGRRIWVEQSMDAWQLTIDKDGAVPMQISIPEGSEAFFSDALCCHYRIRTLDDLAVFTLWTTPESLRRQADAFSALGAEKALIPWRDAGQ